MDSLTPADLGARLARLRLQLGQARQEEITQRRLAHALGIKPQAYNSWEQGKTCRAWTISGAWHATTALASIDSVAMSAMPRRLVESSGRVCGAQKVRRMSKPSNCSTGLQLGLLGIWPKVKWR